jgi:dihydroflavonol-4-reductase
MTTLIIGSTGFIGGTITQELLLTGVPVRAMYRKFIPPDLVDLPVEWFAADVQDPISLQYAMEGCDSIYLCTGYQSTNPDESQRVRMVNHEGTINVIEVARKMGIRRIVYTGSVVGLGVNPKAGELANEDVSFNLGRLKSIYAQSKREAELAVEQYVADGMDIVRVYPGFCVGPGDRHLKSSGLILAYLRRLLPGYLSGRICQVDVRDAAHAHILAMNQGKKGARYLIPGHNVTYENIVKTLARVTGRRAPSIRVPHTALSVTGIALERLAKRPLIDSIFAEMLRYTWWYDGSKASLELGIEYRPLENSYYDAIAWFYSQNIISRSQAGKVLL